MRDIIFIFMQELCTSGLISVPRSGSTELWVLNLALAFKHPYRVLPPWPQLWGKGLAFTVMRLC